MWRGVLPPGIPERASVYTFIGWQILAGLVLLAGLRRPAWSTASMRDRQPDVALSTGGAA